MMLSYLNKLKHILFLIICFAIIFSLVAQKQSYKKNRTAAEIKELNKELSQIMENAWKVLSREIKKMTDVIENSDSESGSILPLLEKLWIHSIQANEKRIYNILKHSKKQLKTEETDIKTYYLYDSEIRKIKALDFNKYILDRMSKVSFTIYPFFWKYPLNKYIVSKAYSNHEKSRFIYKLITEYLKKEKTEENTDSIKLFLKYLYKLNKHTAVKYFNLILKQTENSKIRAAVKKYVREVNQQ
ncbi:MAG: hypothetical protein K9M56_10235 [Victivallales bacterium]|nr:hypothetical protein [Victivallales bacterium]